MLFSLGACLAIALTVIALLALAMLWGVAS